MNPRSSVFSGNPRTSIFDGLGVYELIPLRGFGAANCQQGYMEFPEGSGICVPTIAPPSQGCAPGTFDPLQIGVCVPQNLPTPAAGSTCPPGTFGYPPAYCYAPGSTTPVPVGGTAPPVALPPSTPPVLAPPPVTDVPPGTPGEPSWVLPAVVGVGVIGLVALVMAGKSRRASPNRRRRRR